MFITLTYFGVITYSGTRLESLIVTLKVRKCQLESPIVASDTEKLKNHLRNSPLIGQWYGLINGIEKHNDAFVIEIYSSAKGQYAVDVCYAAANYVFEQKQSPGISSVSIVNPSRKELIVINDKNHDCGKPSVLPSPEPPKVAIGMDLDVVLHICGKGHNFSTYESASGITDRITYDYQ